jgi:pyrroline-5-carboxylate reductase
MTSKLAVIGCGNMGRAVLKGLAATGSSSWQVRTTARHADTAARLERELGWPSSTDNAAVAAWSDVVLLGVKPQVARDVFAEPGMAEALEGKTLISICAGVTTAQLAAWAPRAHIVRAMPNTPALIREGMTVLSPGPGAETADLAIAKSIFEAVGRCRVLDEKHLDAVTGLSGSGPAFVCVMLESLADGGVMMGLPRDVAVELAAQTMQGAARLVLETGAHPAALRDSVTTPAGCTIAGLFVMEDGKIRSTLARTIQQAAQVASGLGS